jgi:fatty acid/phospholipid biosynthesis enzyme
MKTEDVVWLGIGGLTLVFLLRKKAVTPVYPSSYPVTANLNQTPVIPAQNQSVVLPLVTTAAGILTSILSRNNTASAIPQTNETAQSIQQIETPVITQVLPNTNPTMYTDAGSASPTGVDEFSDWEYQA